jgi:phosphatidylglycerol:prolipoprotein diacylglycerol transferase
VPAVLTLSFDPVVHLGDTASVRLETVLLAVVLFAGLLLAVRIGTLGPLPHLRIDDLVFMVVGAVPGAVVGGRLAYVIDHLGFYQANPSLITDPGQGGFTLTLAVPLGMASGAIIGRLLGAPIGRWMHALALPLLFVLGAGKLAGVLGGTGQGQPADLAWATAYVGPGPWGSLAADIPSHPSQVYEGALIGLAMLAYWPIARLPLMRRATGAGMWAAIGMWCAIRLVVGFTWRDPVVVAGLAMEQLLALAVGAVAIVGIVERVRRAPREPAVPSEAIAGAPAVAPLEPEAVPHAVEPEGTDAPGPAAPSDAEAGVAMADETDPPESAAAATTVAESSAAPAGAGQADGPAADPKSTGRQRATQPALWDVTEAEAVAEPEQAAPKPRRRSGRGTRGRVS